MQGNSILQITKLLIKKIHAYAYRIMIISLSNYVIAESLASTETPRGKKKQKP